MVSSPADTIPGESMTASPGGQPSASPETGQAFRDALAKARGARRPAAGPKRPTEPTPGSPAAAFSDKTSDGQPADGQPQAVAGQDPAGDDQQSPAGGSDALSVASDGGSAGRQQGLHGVDVQDDGSAAFGQAVHTPILGGADAIVQGGATSAKGFAALAEQQPANQSPGAAAATVQFPDSAWAVSGLDVNVLPDGAVDMVLNVNQSDLHLVSDQLDRLKRRLEAKGVSVAGIQLDASPSSSLTGDTDR